MSEHHPTTRPTTSVSGAVRHHLPLVIVCLVLGAVAGYLYSGSVPTTYSSTVRVLVNPASGNPFVPTPSSVRQDELTSLETEAQVARSAEVLGAVATQIPTVALDTLERRTQVTVPANTQILEISYTARDAETAQLVADTVATAYLDNRARRSEEVNLTRIERVELRTQTVIEDLRAATAAAQSENAADRDFQQQLADALRNELVSLRAQRTALENSETPSGAVIAPASVGKPAGDLKAMLTPWGLALGGLGLGCLLAMLLERLRGVVRSARDVELMGVPVVAAVPPAPLGGRLLRRADVEGVESSIRRLRATMLDLDPRPDVITIAPAGTGRSDAATSEAVAESFAKAGHRVVLVRTDTSATQDALGTDDRGLAQALLYERINVLDLLQPTVEPLLCVLSSGGFTDESRELLVADRVRSVLAPVVESGHLVVIQAPGLDTPDAEALLGAADVGVVVVRVGRTAARAVEQARRLLRTSHRPLTALVLGRRGAADLRSRASAHRGDRPAGRAERVAEEPSVRAGR